MSDKYQDRWIAERKKGKIYVTHKDDHTLNKKFDTVKQAQSYVQSIHPKLVYDKDGIYQGYNTPKIETLDASEKKAKAVENFRRGEATLEDSLRIGFKPSEIINQASVDSARKETLINKLIKDKSSLQDKLDDLDTFDDSGSKVDALRIQAQLDKIETQLAKHTNIAENDTGSVNSMFNYDDTNKGQSQGWLDKFLFGTKEDQLARQRADNWIRKAKAEFAERPDAGISKEWFEENKKRTNQWYKEMAKEAEREYQSNTDPAGLGI